MAIGPSISFPGSPDPMAIGKGLDQQPGQSLKLTEVALTPLEYMFQDSKNDPHDQRDVGSGK